MLRKSSNQRSLPLLWQRCRTLRTLKQIHAHMIINGFLSDPSSLRELIFSAAVSIPGTIPYALQLFDQIPQPDTFMWNSMIRGAAHAPTPSLAVSLFVRMTRAAIWPHRLAFPFLLRACTKLSDPFAGSQFHSIIVKYGLENDVFIRNALISLHANCGGLADAAALFDNHARRDVVAWSALIAGHARRGKLGVARKLFDEMPSKDLVAWNVMITGYAKKGEMVMAKELFDRIPEKDTVSWNVMISGYVQCGSHDKAMEVFDEMRSAGERPDEVTMVSLVSACADTGALDVGGRIHSSLLEVCPRSGFSLILGNALIDMYAKCGSIQKAIEVFKGLREKDVSTWNSVINGLALHGHGNKSVWFFEEMRRQKGVRPDEITFVGVLVACSHGGMVEEGRGYFELMRNVYGIKPNVKHYGCMVDMLGRAGLLEEAFNFVEGMAMEPNPVVWRALLGACRVHGNVELGERVNTKLLKMRQQEDSGSGDYVLLSNIYASMGEWGRVQKVRKLLDESGVAKEAGCAVIEADL